MSNPIRLEILNAINEKELSVDELTRLTGLRKPNVSQHLALLRHARLIRARRNGQHVYYKLVDGRIVAPCHIFAELWENQVFE